MTELGVLMDSCEAKNQGAQYPVSEVVTSVQWVAPLLAYPGSPMSAVLGSAAFPVLEEGAEEEGVSSFLEIAVAGDSDIRGAETWRISLSGTQIGASASCGKTQAYPRPLVNKGSGPFHCPERRSLHFTNGFAFNCSGHQWRSIAVFPDESVFKLFITKRACFKI